MTTLPWDRIESALERTESVQKTGRVIRMTGLLVEGTLPGAQLGMLAHLEIPGNSEDVPAEVVSIGESTVSLMPLKEVSGITAGTPIRAGSASPSIPVSKDMLGRVLDPWGQPLDSLGPLPAMEQVPLYPEVLNPMARNPVDQPLPVGVRTIDTLLTAGQGQRLAIMAGSGVGKSTLLGMMARNSDADVKIIALIGERSREVRHFIEHDLGEEGRAKSVVIAATSNTAAALRIRAARAATSIAEYFRDQGLKVLLLMDSLTRVCMAQRELGLSTGEPPTTRGYPPSSFAIIPQLLERAGPGVGSGSITGFYTVFLEGDDVQDPIGDAIRAVTDGHIVLSRDLANRGQYPAIDVLGSVSRVMNQVTEDAHQQDALTLRKLLADLKSAEELQELGAYSPGSSPRLDHAMKWGEAIWQFQEQRTSETGDYFSFLSELQELNRKIREQEGP